MSVRYLNATGTQALINEIKSRLAGKADLASIQSILTQIVQLSNTIPTKVSQLDNDEGFIDRTTADELYATAAQLTDISDVVSQNQSAINLLNADSTMPGSVDYKIEQAIEGGGGGASSLKIVDCSSAAELDSAPEYFFGLHDYYNVQSVTTDQGADEWITQLVETPLLCHKDAAGRVTSEVVELPIRSLRQNGATIGKALYQFKRLPSGSSWTITDYILQTERSIFNFEIRSLFE